MDHATARDEAMAQLARSKRRAYLTLLVGSVLVLILALVTRQANDAFVAVVYPILIGVYVLVLVLFATHRLSTFWTEIAIMMVTGGAVMLRLAELLVWRTGPLADRLLAIVGGHYWSFAVLLLVCFLLFDRQTALRLGIGLLLTSFGLALFAILRDAAADQLTTTVVVYFLRLHLLLAILLAIVAGSAALQSQFVQVIEQAEVFAERSRTDPLTGLANRGTGSERLVTESEDARRRGRALSVVMLDIDHFKKINDTHGHAVGDEVLVATAEVVSAAIRQRDLLVRWGGEEFLVVLPETTGDEAMQIAERARLTLAAARPHGLPVTATFGVAEHLEHEEVKDLLARADLALYDGKNGGRNQVVLAGTPLRDVA
jgi:diguanylate cyclase (GGDEF)-like protein